MTESTSHEYTERLVREAIMSEHYDMTKYERLLVDQVDRSELLSTNVKYTPADLRRIADELEAKYGSGATIALDQDWESISTHVRWFGLESDGQLLARFRKEAAAALVDRSLEANRDTVEAILQMASGKKLQDILQKLQDGEL